MEKLGHKMTINTILNELNKARQSFRIYQNSKNSPAKIVSAISESFEAAEDYIAKYGLKKYLLS
jgi:hypothetical protein